MNDETAQLRQKIGELEDLKSYIARCAEMIEGDGLLAVKIERLKKSLADEDRSHTNTIDHRDKHEQRINEICAALGMSEEECAWTSHNDPSERAIEYIDSFDRLITAAVNACELLAPVVGVDASEGGAVRKARDGLIQSLALLKVMEP